MAKKVRVPIKKWVDDEGLSFQARFLRLKAHHEEETKWLLSEIERLEDQLDLERRNSLRE